MVLAEGVAAATAVDRTHQPSHLTCRPPLRLISRSAAPASTATPSLSIVIPTYNGLSVLRCCLASVRRYLPPNSEVIVVDDASSDGTAECLRRQYPWVRLIRFEENRGFCAAVNAGIRAARAPIVETLNNDTIVTPGWAEPALRLFRDPTVASVAPRVWCLAEEGVLDSTGLSYHLSGYGRNRGCRRRCTRRYTRRREVFGATASAAFYRRDAVLDVGGFPEEFVAYYDDVDLAFRLRWAGYRCVYEPQSEVVHWGSFSHNLRTEAIARRYALNEERTFWMNLPTHLLPLATPLHVLYLIARTALMFYRGVGMAYLRGKVDAVRQWRRIAEGRAQRVRPGRGVRLFAS